MIQNKIIYFVAFLMTYQILAASDAKVCNLFEPSRSAGQAQKIGKIAIDIVNNQAKADFRFEERSKFIEGSDELDVLKLTTKNVSSKFEEQLLEALGKENRGSQLLKLTAEKISYYVYVDTKQNNLGGVMRINNSINIIISCS